MIDDDDDENYFQNLQDLLRSWRFTVVDSSIKMQKKNGL